VIKEEGEQLVLLVNGQLRSPEDTASMLDYLRVQVPQQIAALRPFPSEDAEHAKAFDLLKAWLKDHFSLNCQALTWTAKKNTYTYESGRPEIGSRSFFFLGTDGYEHTEEEQKAVGCFHRPPALIPDPVPEENVSRRKKPVEADA
jgi:hypothetical protein